MTNQSAQDASGFFYNARASLAKAIAFRSIAIQSLKINERISATVSAYYSLLHLAITLFYLCPDKIDAALCDKLRAKRGQGETDPSSLITHKSALEFVRRCMQEGLDEKFSIQREYAKNLREFVNYGPRITINNESPYFGPCNYGPGDCHNLVSSLNEIFPLALRWACNNSPLDGVLTRIAISKCSDFFTQQDLFYIRWCSQASIEISLEFIRELEHKVNAL